MLISLSLHDPVLSSEGTIDPLGLASIADRLGNRLVPGVRERMRHPRFLTAIAAGKLVCKHLKDDICVDGFSEPFLVYEWILVQALYKTFRTDINQIRGMPGTLKAQDAFAKNDPISRNRYLKNAYTFGFHGVYRTLSEELDLVTDNFLGGNGSRLLRAWEDEQNLPGFITSQKGAGKSLLDRLRRELDNSLSAGEVSLDWNSNFLNELAHFFAPYNAGPKEKELLLSFLSEDQAGFRGILLKAVADFQKSQEDDQPSEEKDFHDFVLQNANIALRDLLETIQHYERFCRYINNCFYEILEFLSDKNKRTDLERIITHSKYIPPITVFNSLFHEISNRLLPFGQSANFEETFKHFSAIQDRTDLVEAVIQHHNFIQESKPPDGKMPWLESFPNNVYMIRPAYRQYDLDLPVDDYVNSYRFSSLISFDRDLNHPNG